MDNKQYDKIIVCPACRSKLVFQDMLVCKNPDCAQAYNIIDDIPVMIPGDAQAIKAKILRAKGEKSMFERKIFGLPYFKVDYNIKQFLYKIFRIRLPKIEDQRDYWLNRGNEYCDEFQNRGYARLEIFFQNLVVSELKKLKFSSIFEAGCGFGWNIKRFQKEFPKAFVGGLDFSHTQLVNGKTKYIKNDKILLTEGDATRMPFMDNAWDVSFSLGVFMNINEKKIGLAIDEMIRVCRKYIIHLEYDENHAEDGLRERRAFKTNIVSHDYRKLYEERGLKIRTFLTADAFGDDYRNFVEGRSEGVRRWESWEGPSKYILIIAENHK